MELPNLLRPRPGVVSGGQPGEEALEAAAEAGYRRVINLRTQGEFTEFDEAAVVDRLGMEYVSIPVAGADGLSRENVEALAAALEDADEAYPVLLHCGSGNRVGALLALEAYWLQGKDADEALETGRQGGLTRLEPAVESLLSGEDGEDGRDGD